MWSEQTKNAGPAFLFRFVLLFLGIRLFLLVGLGQVVHGREFTGDVGMFMEMASEPLGHLLGTSVRHLQHPPLLRLLIAIPAIPFSLVVSSFYAIRLTVILYELLAAVLAVSLLERLHLPTRARLLGALTLLIWPTGWITTVVMAQDESIAAAFVMGALLLQATGREKGALATLSLGVVAGKIFLVLPLAGIFLLGKTQWKDRILAAALPAFLVQGVTTLAFQLHGSMPPPFVPNVYFGCNFWVWIVEVMPLSRAWALRLSAGLTLVLCGLALLGPVRKSLPLTGARASLMSGCLLLWMLVCFFHVNPEYYLMSLLPLVVAIEVLPSGPGLRIALWLTGTLPWAVNFFYGVARQLERPGGGGGAFVSLYRHIFSIPPSIPYEISLLGCSVITLGLALAVTSRLSASSKNQLERVA